MKRVLIVEDETIISFGYRLQLEQMGLDVVGSARTADEAMEIYDREKPDVIIMDVYLKGERNGLQLAQEIHRTAAIPIIFLTASAKPEVVDGIRALEHCHYLLKPIDPEGLTDLLHQTVRNEA